MMGDAIRGRSAEDVCESEAGGLLHRAILLSDLQSAAYAVAEEFKHTESDDARDLVKLAREVDQMASDLSIAPDSSLTGNRECRRCSGNGKTTGEDPCIECQGRGYVHMSEVDE